jgi:hypothetical protein
MAMSHYLAAEVEGAPEGWKADLMEEASFVTKSDEWLVFFLGWNLQIGTLRLFASAVAFVAIGATIAYVVR